MDQRFELGSTEAIKSLVIAGLGVGFFSCWEIQQEIAMGLVRQINIPGLRIQRMFSWALPSGELGGLPGEFYQFANSIRSELSAVSVRPLKEAALEPKRGSWQSSLQNDSGDSIALADMRSEHPITLKGAWDHSVFGKVVL